MKKFLILNQDEEPQVEVQWREFTCGILELREGYYVVNVVPLKDGRAYACAVYRDVHDAADAVAELKEFALKVTEPNQAYVFAVPAEPVSALEVINAVF